MSNMSATSKRGMFRRISETQSPAGSAAGILRRFASLLLTVCLLSSATPAAPQTIVALAKQSSISFAFWFRSRGMAKVVYGGSGTAP